MSTCVYSRGSRLGRPKGSKNKRSAQSKENGTSGRKKTQVGGTSELSATSAQTDGTVAAFDFEHALNTTFGTTNTLDNLLNPGLSSTDPNHHNQLYAPDGDDVFQSLFAHTLSSAIVDPTFYSHGTNTPPNSAGNDSAYATSISSPIDFSSASTNLHTKLESAGCTCLQQQARLVYQLGDLQDFHVSAPTVDRVLHNVELAQKPWQNLMQCAHGTEHEKEIFLLFATSIRILLSSVQRLHRDSGNGSALHEIPSSISSSEHSNVGVLVGNFELTGEAKREVITVVTRRALRIISSALLHLHSRTGAGGDGTETPANAIANMSNKLLKQQDRNSLFLVDPEINDPGNHVNLLHYDM
ncbi:hypothetical protein N0V90_012479 [Kalmusia sp. IMI 367209]|nr:hypothetical protein N0V90_012479 [Kalmusia sp. IMI 367209]